VIIKKLEKQKADQAKALAAHGMTAKDILFLGKTTGESSKL
jgi:hypothetical protein